MLEKRQNSKKKKGLRHFDFAQGSIHTICYALSGAERPFFIKNLILILTLVLISASGFSQVNSSIDTTQIRIGEEIIYSITVEADSTDLVLFPEGQTFLPLEVIESYKIDTTFEQAKYKLIKKYGLTQFDSGVYTLPSQRVVINNKPFNTDSIKIEVADVVVDTTKQNMYTIKPALEVKDPVFDFLKLVLWLVPILSLIGILIYYYFRKKKKKAAAEIKLPPYEEALEALKELDESHFLKNDNSKRYYTALTEIIKRYLHREVDDSAIESTSNELIERLILHRDAGHFDFDEETLKKLESIFKRADLIKFAKMKEQAGQAKVDRSVVEDIINETHEIIPEPTEEELLEDKIYLEKLRQKQLRRKRIKIAIGVVVAILLVGVAFGSLKGFDELKDKTIGNEVRELTEGRWVKSEYGTPLIIIETPKVLVRSLTDSIISKNPLIKETHSFSYGGLRDKLFIKVSTIQFNQEQEVELDKALDAALTIMEKAGAKNMVVKRDEFETEKGIKGIKAYGDFRVQVSDKKVLKEKSSYEMLLFAQGNGLQKIIVVYQDDGRFSEALKNRIINSIEIEITQQKKNE